MNKNIAGLLGAALPLAIYWLGGGEFERGEALASVAVVAVIMGGYCFLAWLKLVEEET